jgi:hypothetical protein
MGEPGLPNLISMRPERRGGPERAGFLGVSRREERGEPARGKNLIATVLRRNGPAHRSHPKAGDGHWRHEERAVASQPLVTHAS